MLLKEVDILGLKYKIIEKDVISKDEFLLGKIDFISQEILIDKTLSEEKKEITLLHEILHGICESLILEDLNQDEQAIQALAIALYHLFKHETILS